MGSNDLCGKCGIEKLLHWPALRGNSVVNICPDAASEYDVRYGNDQMWVVGAETYGNGDIPHASLSVISPDGEE